MRAAWRCGSVAPIRADAALQGCAAFRIALLAPLLGAAPVKALPIWRGTGSSNPSPSSGESCELSVPERRKISELGAGGRRASLARKFFALSVGVSPGSRKSEYPSGMGAGKTRHDAS